MADRLVTKRVQLAGVLARVQADGSVLRRAVDTGVELSGTTEHAVRLRADQARRGKWAALEGQREEACPYSSGAPREAWLAGWRKTKAEMVEYVESREV